jgi:prophage regulatory protein
MSRTWIYDRVAEGEFPAPVKIGQRASAWLESEVNEWLRERAAQRDRSGTAA